MFTNGAGRSLNPDDLRKRVLYPAMDKAKIERRTDRAYGFHLFRHSAGSQMHEATGDLKQTQSFLGIVESRSQVMFTFTCNPIPRFSHCRSWKMPTSVLNLCSTVLNEGADGSSVVEDEG